MRPPLLLILAVQRRVLIFARMRPWGHQKKKCLFLSKTHFETVTFALGFTRSAMGFDYLFYFNCSLFTINTYIILQYYKVQKLKKHVLILLYRFA